MTGSCAEPFFQIPLLEPIEVPLDVATVLQECAEKNIGWFYPLGGSVRFFFALIVCALSHNYFLTQLSLAHYELPSRHEERTARRHDTAVGEPVVTVCFRKASAITTKSRFHDARCTNFWEKSFSAIVWG